MSKFEVHSRRARTNLGKTRQSRGTGLHGALRPRSIVNSRKMRMVEQPQGLSGDSVWVAVSDHASVTGCISNGLSFVVSEARIQTRRRNWSVTRDATGKATDIIKDSAAGKRILGWLEHRTESSQPIMHFVLVLRPYRPENPRDLAFRKWAGGLTASCGRLLCSTAVRPKRGIPDHDMGT
jgi:hypothetical protein